MLHPPPVGHPGPPPVPLPSPVPAPAPLWRTGRAGLVRGWDGHAWVGPLLADPRVPPPQWSPSRLALLTSPRVWLALLGLVLGHAAVLAGTADAPPDRVLLGLGGALACGGVLAGAVWALWRRLRIGEAAPTRTVLVWGVAAGVVAAVVAVGLELLQTRLPGPASSLTARLAAAGPIEETAKLLLPALLWYRRPRFRDPRTGVGVVLVSGATFGLLEGVAYVARVGQGSVVVDEDPEAGQAAALALLQVRATVEVLHPWVTTAAAAVLWLAVWRHGRPLLGRTALAAWSAAVGVHVVQNVAIGSVLAEHLPELTTLALVVLLVGVHQWLRRATRELAPPSVVGVAPPRWRPAGPARGALPPPVHPGWT